MKEDGVLGTRGFIVLVLLLVTAIFILQNSEVVDVVFFFWRVSLSRVILLLIAVGVGVVIGFVFGWEVFGRKKPGPRPHGGGVQPGS